MIEPVVIVRDAGWHFSSLGGREAWLRKVEALSHNEPQVGFKWGCAWEYRIRVRIPKGVSNSLAKPGTS